MKSGAIASLLFLVLVVAQYVAAQDDPDCPTTITVTVIYAGQATPSSSSTSTPVLAPTTSTVPPLPSSSPISSIASFPSGFASSSGIASSTSGSLSSSSPSTMSSSATRTGTAATPTLTSLVQDSGARNTKINFSMAMVLGCFVLVVHTL